MASAFGTVELVRRTFKHGEKVGWYIAIARTRAVGDSERPLVWVIDMIGMGDVFVPPFFTGQDVFVDEKDNGDTLYTFYRDNYECFKLKSEKALRNSF